MQGAQTPGPRGTPGHPSSSDRSGPLGQSYPSAAARPSPAETTTPGRSLTETHAGLRTRPVSAAPPRAPSRDTPPLRTPRPRSPQRPGRSSCLAPGPSALGGTFSFCFRGISIFPMAVSDSKSASLRSFPGITQHGLRRATNFVHRVERKRLK